MYRKSTILDKTNKKFNFIVFNTNRLLLYKLKVQNTKDLNINKLNIDKRQSFYVYELLLVRLIIQDKKNCNFLLFLVLLYVGYMKTPSKNRGKEYKSKEDKKTE